MKRAVDVSVSAAVLALASPLLAMAALAIRLSMGSPVLFRQTRPGQHGTLFTMVKFRTMENVTDASGHLLPDSDRITGLGRMMRSLAIDELPQFWNVLCGEMSLVGPRPLRREYLERYSPEQARRHDVLPGITGWAQINGRNAVSWDEKFSLDVWYVDNWSLWLDLRILCRTPQCVLQRVGVTAPGHATMPDFQGNEVSQ
ncbi:MAG: sugar transferase [Actinomycetota bacterium]